MKTTLCFLTACCAWQTLAAQPPELIPDPLELTAMREAWLREKHAVATELDRKYLVDLEAAKDRYAEAGDKDAVKAIEKELAKLSTPLITGSLTQSLESSALRASQQRMPKQKITNQDRRKIEAILEGKIWRVDHGGEGLRWYYFAKDGKFARKSRLTEWVWSDLDGTWKIDDFGTVVVTGVGNTAQISIAPNGTPSITLNRNGVLTVRPFFATNLTYPGPGKE